jgi:hypothetical protein
MVAKQEDGLSSTFDDIHVRITTTTGYTEVAHAMKRFVKEYNQDPPNKGRIYDWYIAEADDLLGLASLDLTEESEDD